MADTVQIVGFILGSEHYGIDIMSVESIIKPMEITPVPRAPEFVEGIINLRGSIIPIVDLRKRLNIARNDEDDNTRIVVTIIGNRRLGIIVDVVEKVMHIPEEQIDAAPGTATGAGQRYVQGVARTADHMIIILDVFNIFSDDEHKALEKIK